MGYGFFGTKMVKEKTEENNRMAKWTGIGFIGMKMAINDLKVPSKKEK